MSTPEEKQITLEQFISWLEGVEDMQEDDWAPSQTQWNRIRDKINQIQPSSGGHVSAPMTLPTVPVIRQTPPSAISSGHESPSVVPALPTPLLDDMQGGKRPIQPAPIPLGGAKHAGGDGNKVRTPDIDTSNGQYQSKYT